MHRKLLLGGLAVAAFLVTYVAVHVLQQPLATPLRYVRAVRN
jgi:hypothetical protein